MHEVDADQMQRACKLLGETIFDPSVWPLAMEEICRAVGAEGAVLLQGDVRTPDVPRTASVEEAVQQYFGNDWHIRDSRAKHAVPLLLRGACAVIDQDLMSAEQIRTDQMYNELLIPLGLQWFAGVGFWAGALGGFQSGARLHKGRSRSASLMAEGLSPEELRISRETARNQLKAVFSKTATHRQGELVALLGRFQRCVSDN